MMIKWSLLVYILLSSHFVEASEKFRLDWTLGTDAAKKDVSVEYIKRLVERGADPNTLRTRVPPLISAIRNGHTELAQYLLNLSNINPNVKILGEETSPISLAIRSGNFDLMKVLLNRGAEIGAHSIEFRFYGTMSPRILDFLLSINPDLVDYRDANGNTPLHHAVMKGNTVNAKILRFRTHRADILARNRDGKTALDLAHEIQQKEIIAFLTEDLKQVPLREFESDRLVQDLIEEFENAIWKQEKIKELAHYEIQIQNLNREIKFVEKLIDEKTSLSMDTDRILRDKLEKIILSSPKAMIRSLKGDERIGPHTSSDRLVRKVDKGSSLVVNNPYGTVEFTKQKIVDEVFLELESLHTKLAKLTEDLENLKTRCIRTKSDLDSLEHEKEKKSAKQNEKSNEKEENSTHIKNERFEINFENQQRVFTIEPMLGNGDCAYLALNLTREDVRYRLIESLRHENRVRVINYFTEEILAARTENPQQFARDMRLDDNEISVFNEDEFRNFIRTQKTDELMIRFMNFMTSRGQWLSYIRNTRGMMDAILLVFGLEIYIFGEEGLHNHYLHANPQRTVYMLFRNGNHFDRLIPQNIQQEQQGESSESNSLPPANELEFKCSICCDELMDHALIPCGHMFCKTCAVRFKECPLCRVIITAFVLVRLAASISPD